MARAKPWHSVLSYVHHVCTECKTGNDIAPRNRREGTGNRRLCDECEYLIKRGEC